MTYEGEVHMCNFNIAMWVQTSS